MAESRAERMAELRGWPKWRLVERCAELGHHGVSHGVNGIAGWTPEELRWAILRSEFPAEASNG